MFFELISLVVAVIMVIIYFENIYFFQNRVRLS